MLRLLSPNLLAAPDATARADATDTLEYTCRRVSCKRTKDVVDADAALMAGAVAGNAWELYMAA